jgi:AraC family transcriptional regulator, melibiose operon regulatory protein
MDSFNPGRADFEPYGFTCVRWRPSVMPRPDRHNEVEMNLLRSGTLTYLLGGRKVRVEARQLSVFWAAIPHQILEFEGTAEYFVATLPLAWFIQCRLPEKLVKALLRGEMVTEVSEARARSDLWLLAHWEVDLNQDDRGIHKAVLLEMEARLLRLTSSSLSVAAAARQSTATNRCELTKVEEMACLIAQRYTEPLTVEQVAKPVGLHPNYAMALFKRGVGTTIVDYITKHRVSHAQRLLATTQTKIVDVALSSGFASTSRFNAAFRQECGCSPREYRQRHHISTATKLADHNTVVLTK